MAIAIVNPFNRNRCVDPVAKEGEKSMAAKQKRDAASFKLNIKLDKPETDREWPEIAAYLFNRSNRLIAKADVEPGKKISDPGIAAFEGVDVADDDDLTVKIGMRTDDTRLLSRQRLQTWRVKDIVEEQGGPTVHVDPLVWICWLKKAYHVTGSVDKWVGSTRKPICVGEVDIYDVDVRCFLRLPDLVIERVRDSVIDVILDPPPFDLQKPERIPTWWDDEDDDWCGTPHGPRPLRDTDIAAKLDRLPREWAFAKARVANAETVRARFDQVLSDMPVAERQIWLNSKISEDVNISQVAYSNTQQFREMLVEHFQTFRYWLCWYPWIHWLWWPWCRFYGLELLGTATLQSDGSFSEVVWLSVCHKDQPDLWFRVRQSIGGTERTIYARYPILCHTYWNHPSGDPVNLLVTDPDAVACEKGDEVDTPGVYVMPLGIGDDGWYDIDQAHLKAGDIPGPDRGLFQSTDPYGTRLDIRMQFHDALRSQGVEYYRWSYAPSGTSSWTYLVTPITHRYLTQIGTDFFIVPEEVGPFTVGGTPALYRVPDATKDWVGLNRNDRAFGIWNTAIWNGELNRYEPQIPDGRYILRLEMFSGAGVAVAPGPQWNFFLPTAGMTGGVWPVDDAPHVEPDGSVHFNVWVDNTDTFADVQTVGLGGTPTGECQFIEYSDLSTDRVAVTYVAYHKVPPARDFLSSYSLRVKRGVSGTTVASFSSTTPAPASTTQLHDVADLLAAVSGKGPFDRCAFAVELHTYPRTRDGFARIRQYEDHDTSAFALMPA
ncbi:MAG: hypothetical protein JJ992_18390 [Planctomycetes bacterium]|nr:hypothetical protein [Planctomycetota bacterium]